MFPHEFIVSFPRPVQLFRIKTLTKHGAFGAFVLIHCLWHHFQRSDSRHVLFRAVRKISLERCEKPQPTAFEKVYEVGTSGTLPLPRS